MNDDPGGLPLSSGLAVQKRLNGSTSISHSVNQSENFYSAAYSEMDRGAEQ